MREFKAGAKHPDIELIQLALTRAGYTPGPLDGIFGPKTKTALSAFRKDRGKEEISGIMEGDWRSLAPFLAGYVSRTIRKGDTVHKLAVEFRTSVDAIRTANPTLRAEHLNVGDRLTIPLGFDLVPTNIRFTSKVLYYTVRGLVARYPKIRQETIGQSITGREIPVLLFGEGTHEVSYNAAHHGNEWITAPVLLKFLEDYAKAESQNGQIAGQEANLLYTMSTLHLVPMVNPDGVDLATGALDTGPEHEYAVYLAENYPHIPFPTGWKANARGVDLNLQYPAGWEQAKEIKFAQGFTKPGPRDYVGKAALSEPESRALYDYTMRHNFYLTLAYHSQGEVIYWRYLDHLPPGSKEIGKIFAQLSGYTLEETPFASGHAGYKDWFILHFNRPSYTFEVGLGENPLPLSQFDKIYKDNQGVLAIGLILTAPQ